MLLVSACLLLLCGARAVQLDVATTLVRRAASTEQIATAGAARWQLDTEGFFECNTMPGVTPQCSHLRFSAFEFHRHELEGVSLSRVRVLLETRAAAPDVVAVDLVRLVANAQVANMLMTNRTSLLTLNDTLTTVEFAFDAAAIDAQLMQGVGTIAFEEEFSVEVGFAALAGDTPVEVHVHGVTIQLDFEYEIELIAVSPKTFQNRTGGEALDIQLTGVRSFGGFKCRFGDLVVPGALAGASTMLTTADVASMMTATTPNTTASAPPASTPTPTTTTSIAPTDAATSTAPPSDNAQDDDTDTTTPTAGIVRCLTPRVPRSNSYNVSISLDGGRTFFGLPSPNNQVTIGQVVEVPDKADWSDNTIVIRAAEDSDQFDVETNFNGEETDRDSEENKKLLNLKIGTKYTFIAATDCGHPVYLSTGKGGVLRNLPTAVMEDRLDNSPKREICEGQSFEFTPTKSYPEVFYYQSTLEKSFGHKILLDKTEVKPASSSATLLLSALLAVACTFVVIF